MSNSKIDMPQEFGELAARGSAMLKQGGRIRKEALRQGLAVLRTGRVGAERLPMVQQAVSQSRQATAQSVGTTQAELARRNVTGPFAGRALAGVRQAGAARTAAIPTDIAQSVINQAAPMAMQTSQLGMGALGQAGQGRFATRVFNAQAFSQATPFMQTGSRGLIGGICLHPETPIDTPKGPIEIRDLRPGDEAFSEGSEGNRVAVTVTQVIARRVLPSHKMLEYTFEDGFQFLVSPRHPMPDGRPIAATYPEPLVSTTTRYTYDILVGSASGVYFVHGLALGSTLNPRFFRR